MEKRYDRIHYMDTRAVGGPAAVWKLINEGIVSFDDDLSPKTETKQFIADKSEREFVSSYKPSFKYSAELDHTDPVSEKLYEVGADQKVGVSCDIVTIDLWTLAAGTCTARKGNYNLIPSKAGSGEAGGALKMEGTLTQSGDLIKGTWTVATSTFTPAV